MREGREGREGGREGADGVSGYMLVRSSHDLLVEERRRREGGREVVLLTMWGGGFRPARGWSPTLVLDFPLKPALHPLTTRRPRVRGGVKDQADGNAMPIDLIHLREARTPPSLPPVLPSSTTYLNHHLGSTQGGDSRGTQRSQRERWARHDY